MEFTLFTARCSGRAANCLYPDERRIKSAADLKEAVKWDHVSALYHESYRTRDNFRSSDVLVMDCDNSHTDDPADWMTGERLLAQLPQVAMAIVPSRNDGKEKDGKSARPRFHVYFKIDTVTDASAYADCKHAIYERYPFFDGAALDSARFLYGCQATQVWWQEGTQTIDQLVATAPAAQRTIPAGSRNNTMSHFAGRIIKRYGDTEEAHRIFLTEAEKCDPPLEDAELKKIWQSAVRFGEKIQKQQGYISPDAYNRDFGTALPLRPDDYSDIGQAKIIAREYAEELRYTDGTDYIRYNGIYWEESRQAAVGAAEEFLDLQLAEARNQCAAARKELEALGIAREIVLKGGKTLEKTIEESQYKAYAQYQQAEAYLAFVQKRRDMRYVLSALQALKPMVQMPVQALDANEFLLNTPSYTFDLRRGMDGIQEHRATDFITKCTEDDPGDQGEAIWNTALRKFFTDDEELIAYAQEISGLMAIGKVYVEALVIAYGDGRNGKSTYWNSLARIMGSYCGGISADALTAGCKRNVRPEMAELKGKRLIIAAEMEEGVRLSTSILKQLCSTDEVSGEKKYKDPFKFVPTHTLVLYTNHLPRVGASDEGTWRRLIVIPFNAQFDGTSEIKNYSDYLVTEAGPTILKWIIEGAKRVIEKDYHLTPPPCVLEAIQKYREQNNWLRHFLDERCEVEPSLWEKSGDLYSAYRAYCQQMNEYTRSTTDFYAALENAGFERKRKKTGQVVFGLKLRPMEFMDE